MPSKNNAISSIKTLKIEEGFTVLTCQNEKEETAVIQKSISRDVIQFHFCLKGAAKFNFNGGHYSRDITEDMTLLLYNPQQELPLDLEIQANSWTVSLLLSIKKFHRLFSEDANYIDFLKDEKSDKKYYQETEVSPSMTVALNQILNFNLHDSVKKIYLKGKAYELIGLYFNRPEEMDVEQCPFLIDEANVRKIKAAKKIIMTQMADPPTLQELSKEIGLSLKKLKTGFKEVYGDTVYGFLFDYKMEVARKLLEDRQHNVNEVGLKIGYSTASHFISAFKKKFGTTPKKYVQGLQGV